MAEKSITMVIRARDEATRKARETGQQVSKALTAAVGPFIAIGALMSTASKAAAAGVMLHAANAKKAGAEMRGDAEGMLKAQLEVNKAWSDFGRAIPIVGESIARIMDSFSNTEAIQAAIVALKEIKTVGAEIAASALSYRRELELARAEAAGASEAGMEHLKALHKNEDRRAALVKRAVEMEEMLANVRKAAAGGEMAAYSLAAKEYTKVKAAFEEEKAAAAALQDLETAQIIAKELEGREKADADWRKERAAAAAKAAEEERREAEKTAADKARFEDDYFNQFASARERELREVDRYVAEMMEKFGSMEAERTRIEEIGAARRAEINARFEEEAAAAMARDKEERLKEIAALEKQFAAGGFGKGAGGFATTEVAAFQSRFLTKAPGRETPAWAEKLTTETRAGSALVAKSVAEVPEQVARLLGQSIKAVT